MFFEIGVLAVTLMVANNGPGDDGSKSCGPDEDDAAEATDAAVAEGIEAAGDSDSSTLLSLLRNNPDQQSRSGGPVAPSGRDSETPQEQG